MKNRRFNKFASEWYKDYFLIIIMSVFYLSHKFNLHKITPDMLCHLLCSYIHWINIPVAFYIYSYNPNDKNMLDMVGVTTLSISSYIYHYDICQNIIAILKFPNNYIFLSFYKNLTVI